MLKSETFDNICVFYCCCFAAMPRRLTEIHRITNFPEKYNQCMGQKDCLGLNIIDKTYGYRPLCPGMPM